LTLPLIHALSQMEPKEERRIRSLIKSGKASENERKLIIDLVKAKGGLQYASRKAREYSASAKDAIAPLPDSPSKTALIQFADFVIEREK
ncbi:MAG TPA: polyprenyl synthetase family protein, partial [Candidatus Kapabacteria bacterium]